MGVGGRRKERTEEQGGLRGVDRSTDGCLFLFSELEVPFSVHFLWGK